MQFLCTTCPSQETCHMFWLDRQYLGLCLMLLEEKLAHSIHVYDASQCIENPVVVFFSLHEQTSAGLPSCSFKPGTQVPQPEVFGCAAGFSTQHIPTCSHLYIFYILPNLHFVGSALQTFSIAKGKLTAHASLNFILRPGACHRA